MDSLQNNDFAVPASKKRQAKATSIQIDAMVDYFVQHPHVATGKFQSLYGKDDLSESWEVLAENLNSLAKNGKTKNVQSWKSTWRDNKTAVSQKVAKLRAHRATTGNIGGLPPQLTERDQKILGLMGMDYVEGLRCPDAFPEEHPDALQLLSTGQEDILQETPVPLTLREDDTEFLDLEILDESPYCNSALTTQEHTSPTRRSSMQAALSQPIGAENRPKILKTTRRSRQRLGTRLQNAEENFVTLAERQTACMEMFAKAMQTMAENEARRDEMLREFLQTQRAHEKTFLEVVSVLKDCVDAIKNKNT